MRISAKAEYACLAVITLALRDRDEGPMPIREIAESRGIPEPFLTQILLKLKAAGIVQSTRGSSGGYRLAKAPEDITLGEILGVMDGYALTPRIPQGPAAPFLAGVWDQLHDSESRVLTRTSVADLARRATAPDWVI
ncbi:HTH-type transcriptional regulator CymR [Aquisphaera giovannonii]|uniref:HTH-type transcriptional regulator CymR n=1 Tax=Aquisphaera giovannonii TaxID=406548 RepID=A0A5B9VW44_9BACT|nr:Rrf2 family transcriptional regulator [Aquisphaera giovannonii]QEH32686.1 HTH-type transcriptional regulator CymR [Aquisphaera giovannonii]